MPSTCLGPTVIVPGPPPGHQPTAAAVTAVCSQTIKLSLLNYLFFQMINIEWLLFSNRSILIFIVINNNSLTININPLMISRKMYDYQRSKKRNVGLYANNNMWSIAFKINYQFGPTIKYHSPAEAGTQTVRDLYPARQDRRNMGLKGWGTIGGK